MLFQLHCPQSTEFSCCLCFFGSFHKGTFGLPLTGYAEFQLCYAISEITHQGTSFCHVNSKEFHLPPMCFSGTLRFCLSKSFN